MLFTICSSLQINPDLQAVLDHSILLVEYVVIHRKLLLLRAIGSFRAIGSICCSTDCLYFENSLVFSTCPSSSLWALTMSTTMTLLSQGPGIVPHSGLWTSVMEENYVYMCNMNTDTTTTWAEWMYSITLTNQ